MPSFLSARVPDSSLRCSIWETEIIETMLLEEYNEGAASKDPPGAPKVQRVNYYEVETKIPSAEFQWNDGSDGNVIRAMPESILLF